MSGVTFTRIPNPRTWTIADFRAKAHTQPKSPDVAGTPAFPDGIFGDFLLEVEAVLDEAAAMATALKWNFDNATAMADPGTGDVRLNHATLASVTGIALSALTLNTGNPNVLAFLNTWDDSGNSTVRGHLQIRKVGDEDFFAIYRITGSVTDNTTWVQLAVTHLSSNDTLTDGDDLVLQFFPAGPPGADYTSNAALNAIAGVTPAANKMVYFTDGTTAALADISAFGRSLIDDADAATAASTITAIAQGVHTIPCPAVAMMAATTNGATFSSSESSSNKVMRNGYSFDPSTEQYVQFCIPMPVSWNEGTVVARFHWYTAGSGTNAAVWSIQGVACGDNDTSDVAFGTAVDVTDASNGADKVNITASTSAVTIAGTPAAGDLVFFRVRRKAADAADTHTSACILLAVALDITINATTD